MYSQTVALSTLHKISFFKKKYHFTVIFKLPLICSRIRIYIQTLSRLKSNVSFQMCLPCYDNNPKGYATIITLRVKPAEETVCIS